MVAPSRRYRIELASSSDEGWAPRAAPPPRPAPMQDEPGPDGHWATLQRLAADLHAMRDAIATTKSEVADLQRSPSGAPGMHRAACELDAVSSAAERATTTILGAVEEIELSANLLKSSDEAGRAAAAEVILDRVLVLYEACNFQDIAGQRIRKVVGTLKFVEERLDRVIAAWGADTAGRRSMPSFPDHARLLGGPSLPGDQGHVSQSDVDAFFT